MNYTRYASKNQNTLWLAKSWTFNVRSVFKDGLLAFRVLRRVLRGRTTEYQVLTPDGKIENAFGTVGDAMKWCLERLDQERGG